MPRVKLTNRNLLKIGEEEIIFDHGKTLLSETIAAEKAAGMTWPQILAGLQAGVSSSIRPVVWIMRKRSNPSLRISEVEFSMEEYELIDPDFEPNHWVVVDDDYGTLDVDVVDVDDDGNRVQRPQDTVPETDEAPKDKEPLPEKG